MKGEGDQGSRVAGARIEGRSASGVEGWSRGGVSTHSTGSSIAAADEVAFLAVVIVETKLSNP